MKFLYFALLAFASVVSANVLVDAPISDNFNTRYKCIDKDANGEARITFEAGSNAVVDRPPKALKHYPEVTSGTFLTSAKEYTIIYTVAGPHYVYLYDSVAGVNIDWVQVEVVEHGYLGDCAMSSPNPPTGWTTGFPPV